MNRVGLIDIATKQSYTEARAPRRATAEKGLNLKNKKYKQNAELQRARSRQKRYGVRCPKWIVITPSFSWEKIHYINISHAGVVPIFTSSLS